MMKLYQIMSNPLLTSIGCALTQSAMERDCTPVEEEKYEYTAHPRFIKTLIKHLLLGSFFIEELLVDHLLQYSGNLKPGTFIHLDNMTLTKQYCGFEQPMLFAELGRAFHHECSYHFFSCPTPLHHDGRISSS